MIHTQHNLQHLLSEYENLATEACQHGKVNWDRLRTRLVDTGDWTDDAATALLLLVRQYGSFMLRNAAALSLALDIDDGDCGF